MSIPTVHNCYDYDEKIYPFKGSKSGLSHPVHTTPGAHRAAVRGRDNASYEVRIDAGGVVG
jgi:hypothetical protein